jgi:Zn-dependent protease with chaperone function
MIARSTPWGSIQFGEAFDKLTPLEQAAVIAHERGHIVHRHAIKRLLWVLTLRAVFQTEKFFEMCEKQEMEADRYAVSRGHRAGLISFLFRSNLHVKSAGYPTHKQRIEAIHG